MAHSYVTSTYMNGSTRMVSPLLCSNAYSFHVTSRSTIFALNCVPVYYNKKITLVDKEVHLSNQHTIHQYTL